VTGEQRAARALHRILTAAVRAPSVHNSQPWRWRGSGRTWELHADRSRQLHRADPQGRNLVISCGCALHHVQVVGAAMGWHAQVSRLPEPDRPDLLARVTLSASTPVHGAAGVLEAVARRATDRRRFTSWPVPEDRLTNLIAEAAAWQAHALPLTEVAERFRAEMLVNRAADQQRADPGVTREQESWLGRRQVDGVPAAVLPSPPSSTVRRTSRFASGLLDDPGGREVEGSDGLVVMYGHDDDRLTWLRTGEGLGALWLAATRDGLSIVPLSQVVEVGPTRAALRHEVLGGMAHPMLAVRVGWQAIGRSQLPRSPRRPVDEILDRV
jgi:nitroreductase